MTRVCDWCGSQSAADTCSPECDTARREFAEQVAS